MSLEKLPDRAVLSGIKKLARNERETTVDILHHLNEIERRELYLKLGYGSLFAYCTEHLRYSSSAAGRRVHAARCIRRFPAAGARLRAGDVNLSTLTMVAPILTEANADRMLDQIAGRSQRDVEAIVARHRPPVAIRDRVRPVLTVVAKSDRTCAAATTSGAGGSAEPETQSTPAPHHSRSGSDCPNEVVRKFLIQFAASPHLMKKLEQARAILSNRRGDLSFEAVFEAGLDAFLEKNCPVRRAKRRRSKPEKHRSTANKNPRAIPQRVRDAVHVRDRGRCAYIAPNGRRCGATLNLQIDHIEPVARGGGGEPTNLRLLCANHNRLEAERVLGHGAGRRFHRRE